MNKLKLQWCLKLELLNGALGFSKSGLELELVHLNVFSLGNTLSLVLASPHIRLLVSLVDLSQEITLDASLFLQMVLDTIKLMFEVLEFAKKGSPLLCFVISNMSSFAQLGFKLDLQLDIMLAWFSSSWTCFNKSAFSAAIFLLLFSKSPRVRLASSTFLLASLREVSKPLLDFSAEALDRPISSVAARTSWTSCMSPVFSFSILAFILESWSICSDISATAS